MRSGPPECGALILEYIPLSADGTLVPMTIGHRISATDNRKNAIKSTKRPPACGALILEYFQSSVDGTLVFLMLLGPTA